MVALAGVGALVLLGARLAGAFEQLRAVAAVEPTTAAVSAARLESVAAPRGRELAAGAVVPAAPAEAAEPPPDTRAVAASGDAHILRMLAADPEFARAADELLNDPAVDAQEARQLLRDFGVHVPEQRP